MTRRPLALFSLVLALALPSLAFAQEADPAGEQAMLDRINALRVENGLSPVARLPELDAIARGHTDEMARAGQLTHVSPNTGTPEDRVRAGGIEAGVVTENVAMHADATRAQEALLASAPHRGNMLDARITHVGISAVRADNAVYVTQLFVERRSAPSVAAAPEPPPTPPAAEPAGASEPAEPLFGMIPPFVERAGEVISAGDEVEAEAPADEATASVEAPAEPAPEAAGTDPSAEAAGPSDQAASQANPLRQLVGIGQALLRAVTQPRTAQAR